jgi:hypothetical protein
VEWPGRSSSPFSNDDELDLGRVFRPEGFREIRRLISERCMHRAPGRHPRCWCAGVVKLGSKKCKEASRNDILIRLCLLVRAHEPQISLSIFSDSSVRIRARDAN